MQNLYGGEPPTRSAKPNTVSASPADIWSQLSSTRLEDIDRDVLYGAFKPLVRRLLRQYGTDADLREELVGEIYLRFCALLEAYDIRRGVPLRAYLVKQLSVSIYTYARHHWGVHRRESPIEPSLEDLNIGSLNDPTSTWVDRLFADDVRRALPAALFQLSQRQRQVLTLRYYEEKSFEDIASRLGVQIATARSLLRHAINNVRRYIAHLYPTEIRTSAAQAGRYTEHRLSQFETLSARLSAASELDEDGEELLHTAKIASR